MKLASLSRAMFLGFVRDRAALIFSILLPVLFLLFFGAIYKNANAPRISLITVGQVSLIRQAQAADPVGLGKIVTVTTSRSLGAALTAVREAMTTPSCYSTVTRWCCATRSPTPRRQAS